VLILFFSFLVTKALEKLKALTHLWLHHNDLAEIPSALKKLTALVELDFTANPKILRNAKLFREEELKTLFRSLAKPKLGKETHNTLKVMLLGEGITHSTFPFLTLALIAKSGKTSIVHTLNAKEVKSTPPLTEQTDGINIQSKENWKTDLVKGESSLCDDVSIEFWDFAGAVRYPIIPLSYNRCF